ncbi:M20/M25/M40 family metallo-hydrolase [Brevibacterium sp. 50QC2O2]|uniref:M20/M25/M40 family metallo-hydrolase n=1 Tax=Brevibacterium TaxID=1696 RepID=UPI00211BDD1E|nr:MULTISPECIES: M20/M25/M40 family metallo-hydrolase [unclassified Brevibacterium]MCQ9385358.1 M20/M25/M40 family metallo-hydrolase [Brevibacterium sp. 68QC2CO]MCQ9387236.1 M20/M25/M40 family metallo-hydrolase [Brevibacterium sp. 50QC2O2]
MDLELFLSQFKTLVECESPTSDPAALSRSAHLVARVGASLLGAAPRVLTPGDAPHLLWRFGSGPRSVVLIGHHDTVWPLGTLARIPFSIRAGVVRGPGTDDMKGGDLIALHALAAVRANRGNLDGVSLLITGDEEIGSVSSRGIIEAEAAGAEAALVFESGEGHREGAVKTGRKGVALYRLEITGRASHAGVEPEKGINATTEVAAQVLRIAALDRQTADGTSVTPTVMTSGTTTNTIPAQASVAIDSRAQTAHEQVLVDRLLHGLRPEIPGAGLELYGGINRPPLERALALPLFKRAARIAGELGHPALAEVEVGGGSDGNFTAGLGVPTLDGLGTVGGGSHADTEHALIEWIPRRVELVAHLVDQLLG